MKRLNKYLLLHYPQLWNLRVIWVVPAIAILHLIFYICGYASFTFGKELHYSTGLGDHIMGESMGFSVLISVLLFIMWLVFYMRNNPFKSFYPLGRWYFVAEFTLIMLIFAGGSTFFNSYAKGHWQSIRNQSAHVDIVAEANTLNLAHALIPSDRDHYRLHACCDSLDYIDSLRDLRRSIWDKEHPEEENPYLYNRRGRRMSVYNGKEGIEVPKKVPIPAGAVLVDIDSAISQYQARQRDFDFNYMHYCNQFYADLDSVKGISNSHQISARLQQMLTSDDRQAVKKILTQFDKICQTYEVNKDIDVIGYTDKVFKYPNHRVDEFIGGNSYEYTGREDDFRNGTNVHSYLAFGEVSESLSRIQHARGIGFDFSFFLVIFYVSFSLAILLFSFRLSARKPWFIALVGSGVLVIVITIISGMMHTTHMYIYIWLFVILLFYILHFVFRSSVRRTLSGVNLVWLTWMVPFQGLIILEFIKSLFTYDSHLQKYPPQYYWIQDNYSAILLVYLLVAFIYSITLLSALYRRWQSMPEE
ncbi:MAG: hypothetical protein JWO03_1259 [Bacteroidetes bacterium]|nr:hypothetical protein [Bacteroidota bacterium]